GRHRRRQRPPDVPGQGARGAEPPRRAPRHRAPRHGREPLRRHEEPRLLRDPGRHHHAEGAPGDRVDHPRPRGRGAQGRPHAALRAHDLQRLLVQPRAQAAAAAHRRLAGAGERHRAREALQGHGARHEPRLARRLALRRLDLDLRGRPRRLQPGRRRRLHPPERAAAADRGAEGPQVTMRLALALLLSLFVASAHPAPFAVQVGDTKVALDTPAGFADTMFTGSPRLIELAESLTSASNRILLFALTDADLRRFTLGDPIEGRRYLIAVTPRAMERERVSGEAFRAFVDEALRNAGKPPAPGKPLLEVLDARPGKLTLLEE